MKNSGFNLRIVMKCNLCNSKDVFHFFRCKEQYGISNEIFDLFKCRKCDFVFLYPKTKSIRKYYFTKYYERPSLMTKFLMSHRSRKFRDYKKGKMLDVGCGSGFFLQAMKNNGWVCYGIEISEESIKYLKKTTGIEIYNKPLEKTKFKKGKFSLITFWHVMEHIDKPEKTIKAAYKILEKNGILFIAAPNIKSHQAKFGSCKWFHLDLPRHCSHFSPKSISYLLEKNGFVVEKIKHFSIEYNLFGYLQTFYNQIGIDFNLLYKLTKKIKPKTKLIKYLYSFFMTIALFPIFLPLSFIFSSIETIAKQGGTIEIYARKK